MPDTPEATLKAIIVDDEELARGILREHLETRPDVEIVAECANGFEAVKAIGEHKPDLLLLDIQMPRLDGFEVLELIEHNPAVIFVTAYDEYALKAFEVHAADYLLKPVSAERLNEALNRVARSPDGGRPQVASVVEQVKRESLPVERILVRDGAKVHVIPAKKIDYIRARDDYAAIWSQGREYLKQETLTALEEQLDSGLFVRVHRSCLLNVEKLVRLEPWAKGGHLAVMADGTKLPVSRSGYARLRSALS